MQVVFVARHYWPRSGAATVRLQAMVQEWMRRGATVTVITARSDDFTESTTGQYGETVLPVRGDDDTGVGVRRVFLLLIFAVAALRELRKLNPTVVVSDPPPTSGLAAILSRPNATIYYIADSWSEMLRLGGRFSRILAALVAPLERWVLRRSDQVIAVRENLAEFARSAGSSNVVVSPYGTDVTTFAPEGAKWDDPWSGQLPYFLYAGNYGVVQGGAVFIEAAELLWARGLDFGLVYMGYGSDTDAIANATDHHSHRMISLPLQPPETAAAAYRGAIAGLASMRPVLVANETRPAKALAAVAVGCPILFAGGADSPFVSEIRENSIGFAGAWEPAAVAAMMVSALELAAQDPAEYAAMRTRCRRHAMANYDMTVTARTLVDGIVRLAVNPRSGNG